MHGKAMNAEKVIQCACSCCHSSTCCGPVCKRKDMCGTIIMYRLYLSSSNEGERPQRLATPLTRTLGSSSSSEEEVLLNECDEDVCLGEVDDQETEDIMNQVFG